MYRLGSGAVRVDPEEIRNLTRKNAIEQATKVRPEER
jgi:hypothetical protein